MSWYNLKIINSLFAFFFILEGVVNDDVLQTLGKAIGGGWDQLARRIPGIEEEDIEGIEETHQTLS